MSLDSTGRKQAVARYNGSGTRFDPDSQTTGDRMDAENRVKEHFG